MRSSTLIAVRRAAYLSLPAGALATGLAFSSPASAAYLGDPGAQAGTFLATQLASSGDRFVSSGYDDYGLTIDAVLGLGSSGFGADQAGRSTTFIAGHVGDYVGSGGEIYSGATAKALLLAAVEGRNPRAFGGLNLVANLESLETTSGRFSDKSQYGDYSNLIGQSLAIIGLERAGAAVPAKSVSYLVKQQCADGGFRLTLDDKTCSSDPDATGFAAQALVAAGGQSGALTKAISYLKGKQDSAGGVGGAGPTAAVNANSTGLAAAAFTAAGDTAAAAKARSYLVKLQYPCSVPTALRGGIAYNADALAAAKAAGPKAKVSDQDRRTTAQAILGVTGSSYLSVKAPTTGGTPVDECDRVTPPPTSSTTSSSSTSSSSTASSSSSDVTGPPVITDGPQAGGLGLPALVGVAAAGGAGIAAGGVAAARRTRGRHTR